MKGVKAVFYSGKIHWFETFPQITMFFNDVKKERVSVQIIEY